MEREVDNLLAKSDSHLKGEWERGWTQRFGLWGLDTDTQKRIRRPSVDLYAEICKENGISSEMVQKYYPEVFEKIFPS